jgi:dihydroflavonol-4-reductase
MTKTVLVTGATGFLGHHVVRRLNEQGVRPRVLELRGSDPRLLDGLDVEECGGHLGEPRAVAEACAGVDTLLHLGFKVSVAGGAQIRAEMELLNVTGTQHLLQCAASSGVRRAVVAGSALGVGVGRRPQALDEDADWARYAFDTPYAVVRRNAEQAALALATPAFAVMSVCPSFTLGPDDPIGAPANKLVGLVMRRKFPVTLPVGFGTLDVRDFADGVLAAAERGRPGRRYLLSGDNVTAGRFLAEVAAVAGVRAPRLRMPLLVVRAAVGAVNVLSRVRGRPAPIDPSLLQIVGRFAWYDTTRARSELGWEPRPLRQTLVDTVASLRSAAQPSDGAIR